MVRDFIKRSVSRDSDQSYLDNARCRNLAEVVPPHFTAFELWGTFAYYYY